MNAAALARSVRNLQIRTRMRVDSALAGQYHSVFKGRGIEFEEAREYVAGDDIRDIDWNVTARAGRPYVKTYVEERDLTVLFAVDASASIRFASQTEAQFCALLSLSAIRNHDRAGLLLFTSRVERFIPPAKVSVHVMRLVRELLAPAVEQRGTDIGAALGFLGSVLHRKAVIFLVSDFLCESFEGPLRIMARRHDLIPVWITDPREFALPGLGLVEFEDAETGRRLLVDTSRATVRLEYEKRAYARAAALRKVFGAAGVDWIEMAAGQDAVAPLVRFFEKRARRR